MHCLGPLTNTFRARAVSIHNVKSSKGTMKAAFISTSSYDKEAEVLNEIVSSHSKSTSVFGSALWKQCIYLELVLM